MLRQVNVRSYLSFGTPLITTTWNALQKNRSIVQVTQNHLPSYALRKDNTLSLQRKVTEPLNHFKIKEKDKLAFANHPKLGLTGITTPFC